MSIVIATDPNATLESTPDAGDTVTTDSAIATIRIDHDGTLVVIIELEDAIDVITIPVDRIDEGALLEAAQHVRHLKQTRDARGEVAA